MILIRPLRHVGEIDECLKISLGTTEEFKIPELRIHKGLCKKNLQILSRNSQYFRVLERRKLNGSLKIIGWIAANTEPFVLYSSTTALHLLYYHSSLEGYSAVRALIFVHEDMFKFAEKLKVELAVTSPCAHTKECFTTILEREGWIHRGFVLIKKTKYFKGYL